jgi:hypothetical protein
MSLQRMRVRAAIVGVGLLITAVLAVAQATAATTITACMPYLKTTGKLDTGKPIVAGTEAGTCKNTTSVEYHALNLPSGAGFELLNQVLAHMTYEPEGIDKKPTVRFTGVNVQVVNGENATASHNGEGNVVIGYDENPATETCKGKASAQTGSHNLILGEDQEFTSYGGIVAGFGNAIIAELASVIGGECNLAAAEVASVTGGTQNNAIGVASTVSGGAQNTAGGLGQNTVSGGLENTVSNRYASILGGEHNTANEQNAAVVGGAYNTASGASSVVAAGYKGVASGSHSFIGGGDLNVAKGQESAVTGGDANEALAPVASISGGSKNRIASTAGNWDWIGGGQLNEIFGPPGSWDAIFGGEKVKESGDHEAMP